tara:strand:- start:386 stop:613 length:228 start_codon:yes stop_codon:yes gene_type:complete
MKRVIFIILWGLIFLISGTVIVGIFNGILIGFTDFDLSNKAETLVDITNIVVALFLFIGLFLGIKGRLIGTKIKY